MLIKKITIRTFLVEREYKQIPAIQILVYQMKDNDIRTNIF